MSGSEQAIVAGFMRPALVQNTYSWRNISDIAHNPPALAHPAVRRTMDTCFADGFLMPMLARVANSNTANLPPTHSSSKGFASFAGL
jgi:hypothetical protein